MRVFAEAMRRALKAQITRDPDLEIATIEVGTNATGSKTPAFADVKTGDGVMVTPTPITAGEEIQVWYGGLLAKNGATNVYFHYGVGPGPWQDVHEVQMSKVAPNVFSCLAKAAEYGGRLEFCFRDGAGNWDNNTGRNWSFTIHNGLIH